VFLSAFNQEERLAFLILSNHFMELSDNRDLSEQILAGFRNEMNIEGSRPLPNWNFEDCAEKFYKPESKAKALIELIGFGHIDSNYSVEESEFVKKLALSFCIDENKLVEMENWVFRMNSLINEVNHFWED